MGGARSFFGRPTPLLLVVEEVVDLEATVDLGGRLEDLVILRVTGLDGLPSDLFFAGGFSRLPLVEFWPVDEVLPLEMEVEGSWFLAAASA